MSDELTNKLIKAVRDNHLAVVKDCFAQKACLDSADENGWTALFHAAEVNAADIADYLLKQKANPNQSADDGWTALMMAAFYNRARIANLLILHGAKPNAATDGKWTALMYAAKKKGSASIVSLLLQRGADVKLKTTKGKTALDWAKKRGHPRLSEYWKRQWRSKKKGGESRPFFARNRRRDYAASWFSTNGRMPFCAKYSHSIGVSTRTSKLTVSVSPLAR